MANHVPTGSPASKPVTVALLQAASDSGDVAANLRRLRRVAGEAAAAGAAILVTPELFLSGYNIGDRMWELAEPADGPMAATVGEIAREAGIAIVYGYPERVGRDVHNSAQAIDRAGRPVANYRKVHLYGAEEKRLFRPGDRFVTCRLEGLGVGILICYDIEFPEPARILALRGADLLLVPTALDRGTQEVATRLVPARALENRVAIAYANHCGIENGYLHAGLSLIAAPDGAALASAPADGEILLVAPVDMAAYRARDLHYPYLAERRPDLYDGLLEQVTARRDAANG
ncbi:carbon-nitrogen hydrolase family protein [Oceanibacterium hippocampi]|uniref:(R)-stereoselective amidase n=1 Tax=Oceanibacterium hippocampi TaxID=745714 RepID=A0A1Y5R7L8_9PROT|nr:carbon-nitrogen hydrolase family protein [Oceanibacterium hippocampi]SLN10989.1 (R)-stereoselective amidase [Oceanibacterium hippocampi]